MNLVESLNDKELEAASQFIDSVLELEISSAMELLQGEISKINSENPNQFESTLLLIIESLWNFLSAFKIITEKADFNQGINHMTVANSGFEHLGHEELHLFSSAMLTYYNAIIDIQSLNFQEGQDKINIAKAEFDKLDNYKQNFGSMIEVMEAESFFLSVTNLMMQQDMHGAQIAMHKASKGMKDLANKYYEPDSKEHNYFMGIGRFFSVYSGFFEQVLILNRFEFDHFSYSDNDIYSESLSTIESLSKVMFDNELARQYLNFSKGISLISQVIFSIGKYMDSLVLSEPKSVDFEFNSLKLKIKNAEKLFIDMGETGVVMLRYCKIFFDQIKNTEKIAKINKVKILKNISEDNWTSKATEFIKLGKNEKAIDLILTSTVDYDHYKSILKLKSRYSRMQEETVAGILTQEAIRVEESKITDAILKVIDLLKKEN